MTESARVAWPSLLLASNLHSKQWLVLASAVRCRRGGASKRSKQRQGCFLHSLLWRSLPRTMRHAWHHHHPPHFKCVHLTLWWLSSVTGSWPLPRAPPLSWLAGWRRQREQRAARRPRHCLGSSHPACCLTSKGHDLRQHHQQALLLGGQPGEPGCPRLMSNTARTSRAAASGSALAAAAGINGAGMVLRVQRPAAALC